MITGHRFNRIPDFRDQGEAWLPNVRAWLNQHGWGCIYIHRRAVQMSAACLGTLAGVPVILCGPSRLGFHAVVQLGDSIIDPDPGEVGIEYWEFALIPVKA